MQFRQHRLQQPKEKIMFHDMINWVAFQDGGHIFERREFPF